MTITTNRRSLSLPKFAAKCIADNYGRRGSPAWRQVFAEVREGQKANHVGNADFAGMSLDEIRANARLRP